MDATSTQSISEIPRRAYSLTEASLATGLSLATLHRKLASGELKGVKVGRRRVIPADELKRLTDARPRPETLATAPEAQHPRDQLGNPLFANAHFILVDIQRPEGQALFTRVFGCLELGRVGARPERYVAAMEAGGGAHRSVVSIPDAEQLMHMLTRVLVLENPPQRITYALEPELTRKLMERVSRIGTGAAGGRA